MSLCVYLSVTASELLVCPESLVLHEVFIYNDVTDLKRRVCTAPRSAIQNALMTPYSYLKVKTYEFYTDY